MVKQSELKHEVHVSRSLWFVRLYVWLYEASDKDINFCKLFWGLLLAVPVALVVVPVRFIGARMPEDKHETLTYEDFLASEKRGPSRASRLLSAVANGFSWLIFQGSVVAGWLTRSKRFNVVFLGLLACVSSLAALGGLGLGIYELVVHISTVWPALAVIAGWILAIAIVFTIIMIFGERMGLGFKALWTVMCIGARSVKTNTCPRIELED